MEIDDGEQVMHEEWVRTLRPPSDCRCGRRHQAGPHEQGPNNGEHAPDERESVRPRSKGEDGDATLHCAAPGDTPGHVGQRFLWNSHQRAPSDLRGASNEGCNRARSGRLTP
jgi:hypothetical protein